MSSFMTRWSVLQEHAIGSDDRDHDGEITDAAVGRWVDRACDAYLDQCTRLRRRLDDGISIRQQTEGLPRGAAFGRASAVVVSASATEVLPTSFVVSVRLRRVDGTDGQPFNATCVIRVVDATERAQEIDSALRDELIALEHAARHFT